MSVDRRSFLMAAAAAPVAAALCKSHAQAAPDAPPRVDTHLHCFAGKGDSRFPYHARAPYQPEDAATPEHLLACMEGAGVNYAIVVHPEPYQDDHRYLEHCLKVGDKRLKGTVLVFADRSDSLGKLKGLAQRLDVISARIHAYAPDRLPPFGKPELRELWKQATEAGLAIQLHFEPRWAAGFEPLIQEFRETRVIIDHLGRPMQGTPAEHAVVVRWSRFPNTIMKISSLPSQTTYPHRDVQPVIRQLTDAYGAERLIYGGGFGAGTTPASYRAAFERAEGLLAHLSGAERAKVFGENAVRLFGLGVAKTQADR